MDDWFDDGDEEFDRDASFLDASVSENENALTNEGLGWGSFALGALVGSVLPFSPEYKQKQVDELLPEISTDEKSFFKQLIRFEYELELALGKKDYERVFLLMNGFKDCLYGPWKKYLPGNEEYEPSVLFDLYFDDLALSIIDKAENLCDESLTAKITPERLRELEHSSWSLDEKTWEITRK
jgi:hypothetical protein